MKGYQAETGTIIITEPLPEAATVGSAATVPKVAIYTRVSAADAKRKDNLEGQAQRLLDAKRVPPGATRSVWS